MAEHFYTIVGGESYVKTSKLPIIVLIICSIFVIATVWFVQTHQPCQCDDQQVICNQNANATPIEMPKVEYLHGNESNFNDSNEESSGDAKGDSNVEKSDKIFVPDISINGQYSIIIQMSVFAISKKK